MKNRKVYARQVNPAYSGYFIGDIFEYDEAFSKISVCGNRDYSGRETAVFERVYEVLRSGDLAESLENIGEEYSWYKTATEAINDYLPREDGKNYSTKDIHALKKLVEEFQAGRSKEENSIICEVLLLVTREKYGWTTIRGCCQGDWNEVFYPVDEYSIEDIREFETYYFNTGSEWIIHDGDDEPETPEDIDGYSYYCTSYNEREEIAREAGVNPDDVVLYAYHEEMKPYYVAV